MKFTHEQDLHASKISDNNTAKILVQHSKGGSYSKSLSHRGQSEMPIRYPPTDDQSVPHDERQKLVDDMRGLAVERSSIPALPDDRRTVNRARSSRGDSPGSARNSKHRTTNTFARDPLMELSRGISPMREPDQHGEVNLSKAKQGRSNRPKKLDTK